MTKQTTTEGAAASSHFDHLDDETVYEVTLLRAIRVGRSMARPDPNGSVQLKGSTIKEYGPDVIGHVFPFSR